jgi:hypothetical protein
MNSYVRNCYIIVRDDNPLFIEQDGELIPQLDGFLIIPREKILDLDFFIKSLNLEVKQL